MTSNARPRAGDAGTDPLAKPERSRRRVRTATVILFLLPLVNFPLALLIGDGSEIRDSIAGALILASLFGPGIAYIVLRDWQRDLTDRLLGMVAASFSNVRHHGRNDAAAARAALQGEAFEVGAFYGVGLVEEFVRADVAHILTGRAEDVPFGVAEVKLVNDQGYTVFRGTLASFAIGRGVPGLTIVARDRGIFGNIVARLGSGIEPVTLEDPSFEGVFEAYGTDQVQARVILTTTMLERLAELDRLTHARGLVCAFHEGRLLIALRGLGWSFPAWNLFRPIQAWVDGYRTWLYGLIRLPPKIVEGLKLAEPLLGRAVEAPRHRITIETKTADLEPFSGTLSRLFATFGMAGVWIASGSLFGGLAAWFAWHWVSEWGFASLLAAPYFAVMFGLGIAYGIGAVGFGVISILGFLKSWKAPLRAVRRT